MAMVKVTSVADVRGRFPEAFVRVDGETVGELVDRGQSVECKLQLGTHDIQVVEAETEKRQHGLAVTRPGTSSVTLVVRYSKDVPKPCWYDAFCRSTKVDVGLSERVTLEAQYRSWSESGQYTLTHRR